MNHRSDPPRYREIQRWSDVSLVLIIVMAVAAVQWWGFIQNVLAKDMIVVNTASDWLSIILWLAFGLGLPLLAFWLRMVVEVYPDRIVIDYRPLPVQTILMMNVVSVEPRVYGPTPALGGWGGLSHDNTRNFNVSGTTSVQLLLRDRTRLLIGTRAPDRLAAAIASARYDVKK